MGNIVGATHTHRGSVCRSLLAAALLCTTTTGTLGCTGQPTSPRNLLETYFRARLELLRERLGGGGSDWEFRLDGTHVTAEAVRELAESPASRYLRGLTLSGYLTSNDLDAAGENSHELDSREARLERAIGDEGVCLLAGANLSSLFYLTVRAVAMTDRGLRCLAEGPYLMPTLLTINHNCVRRPGLQALISSPWAPRLESLHLGDNPLGDEGARLLADAPRLDDLQTLVLARTGLTDEGARALLSSVDLAHLGELDIEDNELSGLALEPLLDPDHLPALGAVTVSGEVDPNLRSRLSEVRPGLQIRTTDLSPREPGLCPTGEGAADAPLIVPENQ